MDQPTIAASLTLPQGFKIILGVNDVICSEWISMLPPKSMIGFDLEADSIELNVQQTKAQLPTLLQFSTHTSCLLVPVSIGCNPPPSVLALLSSKTIMKACVALITDQPRLFKAGFIPSLPLKKPCNKMPYPHYANGWFDVGLFARNELSIPAPGVSISCRMGSNHGIVSLCAAFNLGTFTKDKEQQSKSIWKIPICEEQQHYAALDAWLALKIACVAINRFKEQRKS